MELESEPNLNPKFSILNRKTSLRHPCSYCHPPHLHTHIHTHTPQGHHCIGLDYRHLESKVPIILRLDGVSVLSEIQFPFKPAIS